MLKFFSTLRASPLKCLALLLLAPFLFACANRPVNDPIKQVKPDAGYRPQLTLESRKNNDPGTFFVLSFSGGGTRAAALSYGVLEELNRWQYEIDGQSRRLLDEVDVITGVSGGSFTALSYSLYGQRLFDEYEERFLKRNVQGALSKRVFLNPVNWFKLMSGNYGRSEIAAEYYDEILFDNATFNDLVRIGGPSAIASTTSLSTGASFAFYQNDFDLICSDLGTLNLSRAAASSSAVPVVLSPVTFNNYAGQCDYKYPAWVAKALANGESSDADSRALARYREMSQFRDSTKHPYLHMVDGGVADNLGVRGVLAALEELSFSEKFRQERDYSRIRRIILIVVNAESDKRHNWDEKQTPPNTVVQLVQSSGVPISHYTFDTVELMKALVREAALERALKLANARLAGASKEEAEAMYPEVEMLAFDVSFDAIENSEQRSYFQSLPTSFSLSDEQVDRLTEIGGKLLRESETYQKVLQKIDATPVQ